MDPYSQSSYVSISCSELRPHARRRLLHFPTRFANKRKGGFSFFQKGDRLKVFGPNHKRNVHHHVEGERYAGANIGMMIGQNARIRARRS